MDGQPHRSVAHAVDPAVQALVKPLRRREPWQSTVDCPALLALGFDRAQNRAYDVALKSTLNGSPLALPGGEVDVTLECRL